MLSLRLLSAVDWNAFFEQTSHVEAILRDDPSGVYPRQDFATSDRYRRVVEKIARGSDADEIEVARRAVELARPAIDRGSSEPRDHVGYYLIDRGQTRARRPPSAIGPAGASGCSTAVLGIPGWSTSARSRLVLAALIGAGRLRALGRRRGSWWILALAAVLAAAALASWRSGWSTSS